MLQYSIEIVKRFGEKTVRHEISGWLLNTEKVETQIEVRQKDGKEFSFYVSRFFRQDIADIFKRRHELTGFDLSFECSDSQQIQIIFSSGKEMQIFEAKTICPTTTPLAVKILVPFIIKNKCAAVREGVKNTFVSGLCLLKQFKGYLFRSCPIFQRFYMRYIYHLLLHRENVRSVPATQKVFSQWGEHLLLVSHYADGTGAPMLALHLAEFFFGFGYNLHIVLLRDGELHERFAEYGEVSVVHSEEEFQGLLLRIRDFRVTKAILNTCMSGMYAELLHKHKIHVTTLIHEMAQTVFEMALSDAAEKTIRFSDKIIIPSSLIRDSWEQSGMHLPKDLTTIMPQPDYHSDLQPAQTEERTEARHALRRELGLPDDAFIIMGCGSLEPRKAPDVFFQTAKTVVADHPNVFFLWIGDQGADFFKHRIESLTKPLGCHARLLSYRNLKPYYHGADLFFLPSKYDPFPTVALLAAKVGMPVLFSKDSSGIRDLFGALKGCSLESYSEKGFAPLISHLLRNKDLLKENSEKIQKIYMEKMYDFRTYAKNLCEFSGARFPSITAVLPNYNYASFLESRIKSIAAQSYPVDELILLDDHSTDNSEEVIRDLLPKYERAFPKGIRYVRNDNNAGVFRQWFRGAEMAKSELIWIAEADDLCCPEMLSRLVPAFLYDPKVRIAYVQSALMDETGKIYAPDMKQHTCSISSEKWNFCGIYDDRTEIETAIAIRNTIPNASAALIRKEAILQISDELFSYRVVGDWFAYLKIIKGGHIAYYPESLNLYRRHRNSVIAKNYTRLMQEFYRIHQYLLKNYELSLYTIEEMKKEYLNNCNVLKTEQESTEIYSSARKECQTQQKLSWCILQLTKDTLMTFKTFLQESKAQYLFVCILGAQETIPPEITEAASATLHLFWLQDFDRRKRQHLVQALNDSNTKIICEPDGAALAQLIPYKNDMEQLKKLVYTPVTLPVEYFDELISLGYNCEVSFHMGRIYSYVDSYPLTWASCYPQDVIAFLEHPEAMVHGGFDFDENRGMWRSREYPIFVHGKKQLQELYVNGVLSDEKLQEDLQELISRMTHLTEKFNRLLNNPELRKLFVLSWFPGDPTPEHIIYIYRLLSEKTSNFKLLVLVSPETPKNSVDAVEQVSCQNFRIQKVNFLAPPFDAVNIQKTDVESWDRIFSKYRPSHAKEIIKTYKCQKADSEFHGAKKIFGKLSCHD